MTAAFLSKDIVEFLFLLFKNKVNYLIVGGEAVIYYGHARLTGDLDIFYGRDNKNCFKLYESLREFWNDDIPGISSQKDLQKKGAIFQFGVPPNRIDLINEIEQVGFDSAFKSRVIKRITYKRRKIDIYYISLRDLIKNKKAVSRFKDKEDLKFLNQLKK